MLVQFLWNRLFSFLLHLRFYQTSPGEVVKHFTPLLSLASLSTYDRSIPDNSFSNVATAFILLNLRVARVNFV